MNLNLAAAQITTETNKKIRTFLYELAEGSSNYRSLHNLTEQVEHQYHGRVVVELLQNAHDALNTVDASGSGRIELVLKPGEGEFGTFYIANDGRCFSQSNFEHLSQLGQSDKSPEHSIGNKGIGFRSVLEITSAPEIYSRATSDGTTFDGFCFAFAPAFIDRLGETVIRVFRGDVSADWAEGNEPLVTKFRLAVEQRGESWLRNQFQFLSPYLMPFPVRAADAGPTVRDFEQRGFVTVVRLPLKNAAASSLLRQKLEEFEGETLLFLEKLDSLTLNDGENLREFVRETTMAPASPLGGMEVLLSDKNVGCVQLYRLWTRHLVLADSPLECQQALKKMPGKWPLLTQAAVSLAVRLDDNPKAGFLSIFLPTLLESGCGSSINAPFFGDMSRTLVDFDNEYNNFLLTQAAALALQVIEDELAGRGVDEARAIVDLLAPAGTDPKAIARWQARCANATKTMAPIANGPCWFLSDQGWRTLHQTSQIPHWPNATVITRAALRTNASFAAFIPGLDSRTKPLTSLAELYGTPALPDPTQLADTVERLAQSLVNDTTTDWRGFWIDAQRLFKGDSTPLVNKQVLLGNDGKLHASDENCTVFFNARQDAHDDELPSSGSDLVPDSLTPYVAFISEQILASEGRGTHVSDDVRRFLEGRLVQRFRVEDIFRSVLQKCTPPPPVALNGPHASLCLDILLWGLRLMSSLVERGRGERAQRFLGNLLTPCQGGWFKLADASFGPGWPNTRGDILVRYLEALPRSQSKEARSRLLLPPGDPRWRQEALTYQKLMGIAGVFDGLRLCPVVPKDWVSSFQGNYHTFILPPSPPPGVSTSLWERYRARINSIVKPYYQNDYSYEVQTLYTFPGFAFQDELSDEARLNLMHLILGSMDLWQDGWKELTFRKKEGNPDTPQAESPLRFFLVTHPWLGFENGTDHKWFRPDEHWYVPATTLAGRPRQFDHLKPLPRVLANMLDDNAKLAVALRFLGMPHYDAENPSSNPRLLNDLALAVQRNEVQDWNAVLGQVRLAWSSFEPGPNTMAPPLLIVKHGGGKLTAERPTSECQVYLPDSSRSYASLEQFDLAVLLIDVSQANRLATFFAKHYPGAVHVTSALNVVPLVDGASWSGPAVTLLGDSDLKELVPLILALVAFAGSQAKGTSSNRFRERMASLRAAKIHWVDDLKAALFHGTSNLANPAVDALWLESKNEDGSAGILLATAKCRTEPGLLGEALALLLKREDLEWHLKVLLQRFADLEPGREEIESALRFIKLAPEELEEVQRQWHGDLGQTIRWLRPLLSLLRPEADLSGLVDLKLEQELEGFMDAWEDPLINGADLIRRCRTFSDLFSFGKYTWRHFGEPLQLHAWNALSERRGEPILSNREAQTEFQRHLRTTLPLLRSLLATLCRRGAASQSFRSLLDDLDQVECPLNYETEFWEVEFPQALAATEAWLRRSNASDGEIEIFRLATSLEDLKERLRLTGVEVNTDPLETSRSNREKLLDALNRLQQIGLAWALAGPDLDPSYWEASVDGYLAALIHPLDTDGYLAAWSGEDIFAFLRSLPHGSDNEIFWQTLSQTNNFQELMDKLGLTEDALAQAQEQLRNFKEAVSRKSRVVQIGGKDFDGSEDNLNRLYQHIQSVVPDANLGSFPALNLQSPNVPLTIVSRPDYSRKSLNQRVPIKIKRSSKAMDALIGLAGEIHAFRLLKLRYNAGPESWISANSTIVFPGNVNDDGRGCDFEISFANYTYYVEVKASAGDDNCFTLGSSEVRLATELVRARRSPRRTRFVVLHITQVLTEQPAFNILPNPFDPRYQSHFLIDGADVRVRYRTET